jgi:hypothetical protein
MKQSLAPPRFNAGIRAFNKLHRLYFSGSDNKAT